MKEMWLSERYLKTNLFLLGFFLAVCSVGECTLPNDLAARQKESYTETEDGDSALRIKPEGNLSLEGFVTADGFWLTDGTAITGSSDLVNDATPQLGGNLDTNGKSILDVPGDVNIKDDTSLSGNLSIAKGLIVDTSTLFVDAGNNRVGIGDTTPASPLEVRGAGTVASFTGTNDADVVIDKSGTTRYSALRLKSSGSTMWYLGLADSDFLGDGTDLWIGTSASATNSNTALSIDRTNNFIGIGTKLSDMRLGVLGDASLSGNISVKSGLIVDTNTLFVNATNNRVGIGTATPDAMLNVSGNVTIDGSLSISSKVFMTNLPTSNPNKVGQLYSNSGVVTVSAG